MEVPRVAPGLRRAGSRGRVVRFLTDLQIAGLVAVIIWIVYYWGPILLDTILDPFRDRFTDIDELAKRDRDIFPHSRATQPPEGAPQRGSGGTPSSRETP